MTVDFAKEYLLDDCEDCPENENGECMTKSHCFEVKRMAIQALEQTRWIPVSEALPPRDEDVLAFHRNESFEYQYISWIDDCTGQWAGFIGNLSDDVLAWMPLPQPYKAERGQDDD